MNNTMKTTLTVIGVITLSAILLMTGIWFGRSGATYAGFGPGKMMTSNQGSNPEMMANGEMYDSAMMGENMMGANMMAGNMMMTDMMGGGSMGTGMPGYSGLYATPDPLTFEAVEQALEKYLASIDDSGLIIGEIMIFDNHAYAQIVEEGSGIGAMEVLVDPVTFAVTPEHGPNMMWNLKYGPMTGFGGGMMGMMTGSQMGSSGSSNETPTEMTVTPEEAVESAQRFLDVNLPGTQVDDHADPFYGYYTLHVLRDGEVVGMLSVNGFSRQVFLHTWHGEFLEMSGE